MRLRAGERWHFAEEKARLAECRAYDPELNEVYGKLLAEVYFRLDKAMQAFFRRVKHGETPVRCCGCIHRNFQRVITLRTAEKGK